MTGRGVNTGVDRSDGQVRLPSRSYLAMTIGLAVFLLAMIASRWGSDRFVAIAQLTAVKKNPEQQWPDGAHPERALCRSLPLQQAVDDLKKEGIPGAKTLDAETLRNQIQLQIEPDSTPLFINFSLSCTNQNPHIATALVNRLGNQLIDKQSQRNKDIGHNTPSAISWHMVPASTTTRQYIPLSFPALMFSVTIGLAATIGAVFARSRSGTISTRKMAESLFSAPVVGTVPAPRVSEFTLQPPRFSLLQMTFSMSEWILCAILLIALLVSALDTTFAHHFFGQPLSALADGVRHLTEIFRS